MCAPRRHNCCSEGAQLRMGVVTQIGDLDNTSTWVRPYGVKVRFGLFARLDLSARFQYIICMGTKQKHRRSYPASVSVDMCH